MIKLELHAMNKLLLVITLTVAVLGLSSACRHMGKGVQGSGVRKTEKRDLGTFTSIQTTGAYEVVVTCQQAASFEIEGDDNILPLIRTYVVGNVLHISNDSGYHTSKPIVVRISVADLEGISSTGAGDIVLRDVKNEKLTIGSTGAARIEASGQTNFVTISSTGAGKVDAEKLHAMSAKVTVTGAGSVNVYATQELNATVSGVGQITYAGDPPVVNKTVSGVGSINKKQTGV
jgi:hypothetical protein